MASTRDAASSEPIDGLSFASKVKWEPLRDLAKKCLFFCLPVVGLDDDFLLFVADYWRRMFRC